MEGFCPLGAAVWLHWVMLVWVSVSANVVNNVQVLETDESLGLDCAWRNNRTEENFVSLVDEERCLYYYLVDQYHHKTGIKNALFMYPPPGRNVTLDVEDVIVSHVELSKNSNYRFNVFGDILVEWVDSRLSWNASNWHGTDILELGMEGLKAWTPKLIDHALCLSSVCEATLIDMLVSSDGRVEARFNFRYDSTCTVDFARYPEEENECCIFFTAFELGKVIRFKYNSDESNHLFMPESVFMPETRIGAFSKKLTRTVFSSIDRDKGIEALEPDHSAWQLTKLQVVTYSPPALRDYLNVLKQFYLVQYWPTPNHTNDIPYRMQLQQWFDDLSMLVYAFGRVYHSVCIHAKKAMSTVRTALKVPISLATLIMLVAPLFGDLRTQALVKLFVLLLQTISFLYLISIAPFNGFQGVKPKIYVFYEMVFGLTALSLIGTVVAMALSRMKRSVPPSHRIYLAAKLVNRALCCVEPDQAASYTRYIDDQHNMPQSTSEPDSTIEWQHIYMAANNLMSGFCLSFFMICLIYDFM